LIWANQEDSIPVDEELDAKRQIYVLPVGEWCLVDERGSGEISGEGVEKSVFVEVQLWTIK